MSLSGPRMGATFTTGQNGDRLRASKSEGGYNMFPVTSMFGYQFEQQYLSSGEFQALVEVIVAVNGLESGSLIPSIAFINGFRFNKGGYEFGLGPVVRVVRNRRGYVDEGRWRLLGKDEAPPSGQLVEELIDNRGAIEPSLGLIVGFGKTFRSGYLNVPVNFYFSPRKDGSIMGVTLGFNTAKKPSF